MGDMSPKELEVLERMSQPLRRNDGPLKITILVPGEITNKRGMSSAEQKESRDNFKKSVVATMVAPWRDEMRRVAPDLETKFKFHFGYKGDFPVVKEGDYSAPAIEKYGAKVIGDVARFIARKNIERPGKYSVTSRDKYFVAVPVNKQPPSRGGTQETAGYFSMNSTSTLGHEIGHQLKATHADADQGVLGFGGTYMSNTRLRRTQYSERNTEHIRNYLGLDPKTGKAVPAAL
ncbi:hypothetical protein [Paraburkholderia humisilvae]|uniref:Uncharacterized protein n=1 Tax=Paraburkholderia humisilvae TaxID=627669 RepID=A0A6J5F846_9BURK|nr:hypothetical protein [Paraburkholderia humisilvae]CAB3774989.1 hypothetical protein LMG29542_08371 [Paraburkholderia humisilvae]